jgi:hypothetical protein
MLFTAYSNSFSVQELHVIGNADKGLFVAKLFNSITFFIISLVLKSLPNMLIVVIMVIKWGMRWVGHGIMFGKFEKYIHDFEYQNKEGTVAWEEQTKMTSWY